MDDMGVDHPLKEFTERCLSNEPALRPTAVEAVEKLSHEVKTSPCSFNDLLQMMEHITELADDTEKLNKEVNVLRDRSKDYELAQEQIQGLEIRLRAMTGESINGGNVPGEYQQQIDGLEMENAALKRRASSKVGVRRFTGTKYILAFPPPPHFIASVTCSGTPEEVRGTRL